MIKRAFIGVLVCSLIAGCWSSSGTGEKGEGEGGLDGGSLSEQDLNAQKEARYGLGTIPTAEGEGMFRDVPFDYDSAIVEDAARQDIEYNARVLEENPNLKVTLEGHCDERGTSEYNMALGAERAKAVKNALVALGASPSRLESISYGEEIPLDPSQDDSAYSKNRRVHFTASAEGAAAAGTGSRTRY